MFAVMPIQTRKLVFILILAEQQRSKRNFERDYIVANIQCVCVDSTRPSIRDYDEHFVIVIERSVFGLELQIYYYLKLLLGNSINTAQENKNSNGISQLISIDINLSAMQKVHTKQIKTSDLIPTRVK